MVRGLRIGWFWLLLTAAPSKYGRNLVDAEEGSCWGGDFTYALCCLPKFGPVSRSHVRASIEGRC